MTKNNQSFDDFLILILDCLQHSEKVECWVQEMVLLADNTFFVSAAFSHWQMVHFFPKLCLLPFFLLLMEILKKNFCVPLFFNKKLDKTQMIKCFSKNRSQKQYQHAYIITGPIYFITITSHFASTILTVPKSVL